MKNVELTRREIKGLLCSAFEGGSNYWYQIESVEWPPGRPEESYAEGGSDDDHYWHWSQLVPLDGGALVIVAGEDGDETPYRLDAAAIARGSAALAAQFPHHWADARTGNGDADTGDAFLQLCLFGELVFG